MVNLVLGFTIFVFRVHGLVQLVTSRTEVVSISHNRAINLSRSSGIINLPTNEIAMCKARFTEHQIIAVIKSVEAE